MLAGPFVCPELGQVTTSCSRECCNIRWYGVCDFVVFSVVEICVDYGGVNVFHVCFMCVLFMVLGFVLMAVMKYVLYVVCLLGFGVV